jgi:hypothetical protein
MVRPSGRAHVACAANVIIQNAEDAVNPTRGCDSTFCALSVASRRRYASGSIGLRQSASGLSMASSAAINAARNAPGIVRAPPLPPNQPQPEMLRSSAPEATETTQIARQALYDQRLGLPSTDTRKWTRAPYWCSSSSAKLRTSAHDGPRGVSVHDPCPLSTLLPPLLMTAARQQLGLCGPHARPPRGAPAQQASLRTRSTPPRL